MTEQRAHAHSAAGQLGITNLREPHELEFPERPLVLQRSEPPHQLQRPRHWAIGTGSTPSIPGACTVGVEYIYLRRR